MGYKLVLENSGEDLEAAVNEMMAQGWTPLGGVSVAILHRELVNERKGTVDSVTEGVYAQAMTRMPE